MQRQRAVAILWVAGVLLSVSPVTPASVGQAQEVDTLRIATLAPRGSQWMRVFQAWASSVRKESDGRLELQVSPSAPGTRDAQLVSRVRGGQLHGATFTVAGLAQTAPAAVVLASPGLYRDLDQLDRVREELESELDRKTRASGYVRLGWVDLGGVRLLAKDAPVRRPEDLRARRPWSGPEDVVFSEVLRASGARGVRLPLGEVSAALRAGRVDVVASSAVGALSMGWHGEVSHVSAVPHWPLVGATLLRRDAYEALDSDLREVLTRTGGRAHATLRALLRRDDANAYTALTDRQVEPVRLDPDDWREVTREARHRLAARHFDEELLERAETLAR